MFYAGLIAGLAIAMQIGAVSLLLIEAAVVGGPRKGVAAGMGVATVDIVYAVIAGVAGGFAGAALAGHEHEIKRFAAAVLAVIALHGLAGLWRDPEVRELDTSGSARSHYARFFAITAINPLTIASFAAVATALSVDGAGAMAAFVLGVAVGTGGWHLFLPLAAGHAGRWVTPAIRRVLAIGGRVLVLAIAVHLAVA
jgi:threonine/homoserine/homoserine lactone efflux protein